MRVDMTPLIGVSALQLSSKLWIQIVTLYPPAAPKDAQSKAFPYGYETFLKKAMRILVSCHILGPPCSKVLVLGSVDQL